MNSLSLRLKILRFWLLSFVRSEWRLEHYPTLLLEQRGVPEDSRWGARILNWPAMVGVGPTREEAIANLHENLTEVEYLRRKQGRPMPRPGVRVPIEFVSSNRVKEDPELLGEFITKALGFRLEDPVFISDQSCISDFGGEERVQEIRANIQQHFGLTLDQPEPVLIADVLDAIREHRGLR